MVALAATDGQLMWQRQAATDSSQMAASAPAAPAQVPGFVYVLGGNTVAALDARTGEQRWRFNGSAFIKWVVVAGQDVLCVDVGGRRLVGLKGGTGDVLWERRAPGRHQFSPATATAQGIYVSANGDAIGLDPASGKARWQRKMTWRERPARLQVE